MLMKLRAAPALAGCLSLYAFSSLAATFSEDFAADPAAAGWRAAGDASLFRWDAPRQELAVTWDSREPNSFFYRPLGTILTRDDDFTLAFQLQLSDVRVGIDPAKPYTFQVAVGFLNLAQALSPGYLRATGNNSPNLVEFDYFPDSGFGATISPTMISTSHQFATSFNYPLELTTNDLFRVSMVYSASNQTLVTSVTRNGDTFGPIANVTLGAEFGDFRLDTMAISSWNDGGQDPQFSGSVLAHGTVDDLVLSIPKPPLSRLTGRKTNGTWQIEFISRSNWVYELQSSTNLANWTTETQMPGTGGSVAMDAPMAGAARYYRVRANRP